MKNDLFFSNIYLMGLIGATIYLVVTASSSNFKNISVETEGQVSRTSLLGLPTAALILSFMLLFTDNYSINLGHIYPFILIVLAILGGFILFDYIEVHENVEEENMSKTPRTLGIVVGAACISYFALYLFSFFIANLAYDLYEQERKAVYKKRR